MVSWLRLCLQQCQPYLRSSSIVDTEPLRHVKTHNHIQNSYWCRVQIFFCRHLSVQRWKQISQPPAIIPEIVKHIRKMFAVDWSNVEVHGAILRNMQTGNMAWQQQADNLKIKYKAGHVLEKGTLKDEFIEGVESLMRHRLRQYRY